MPLNSHSYLVAQGWQGTGKALREGAVSRPVVIAQKKSLAGVGKDRDEAFPFWDHVFTAAATSIKIKLYNDDGDEEIDTPRPSGSSTPLDRTSTGIISNRPQKAGLSTLETLATPRGAGLSIMTLAKRESAKRGLYSRFFRGPILGPDAEAGESLALGALKRPSPPRTEPNELVGDPSIIQEKGKNRRHRGDDNGNTEVMRKKRKSGGGGGTKDERGERRRPKRRKKGEQEDSGMRMGGDRAGLMKKLTGSEGFLPGYGISGDPSRKKDHKERKRRPGECRTP